MGAYILATQGAMASAAMILTMLNRDNSVLTRYDLSMKKGHDLKKDDNALFGTHKFIHATTQMLQHAITWHIW